MFALLYNTFAFAEEKHHHPPEDAEIHERFYKDWRRPDNPKVSCCSLKDCYPTQARYTDGKLYMLRREDQKWLLIPPEKLDRRNISPDGRNHLCAPSPYFMRGDTDFLNRGNAPLLTVPNDVVYCSILGASG